MFETNIGRISVFISLNLIPHPNPKHLAAHIFLSIGYQQTCFPNKEFSTPAPGQLVAWKTTSTERKTGARIAPGSLAFPISKLGATMYLCFGGGGRGHPLLTYWQTEPTGPTSDRVTGQSTLVGTAA